MGTVSVWEHGEVPERAVGWLHSKGNVRGLAGGRGETGVLHASLWLFLPPGPARKPPHGLPALCPPSLLPPSAFVSSCLVSTWHSFYSFFVVGQSSPADRKLSGSKDCLSCSPTTKGAWHIAGAQ